jgi:superfamily I DNA/RNA helicase
MDETTFTRRPARRADPEQREAVMSPVAPPARARDGRLGQDARLDAAHPAAHRGQEVSADQVLAMTFTRKAGDELRKRLFRAGDPRRSRRHLPPMPH